MSNETPKRTDEAAVKLSTLATNEGWMVQVKQGHRAMMTCWPIAYTVEDAEAAAVAKFKRRHQS